MFLKKSWKERSNLRDLSAGWEEILNICLKIFGSVRYIFSRLVNQSVIQSVIQSGRHTVTQVVS